MKRERGNTGKTGAAAQIGIMGGTFNPIHYGHLVSAEAARVLFDLDMIVFMPTGQPLYKRQSDVVSGEERYIMAVLATADNARFSVSRLEIERPGPTYTIDTLRKLAGVYPDSRLFFITGADAVMEIITWKEPRVLAGYCEFIAATRPGYDLSEFQQLRKEKPDLPRVHIMEIPALAISSTDLRRRIRQGSAIRYLLPDPVAAYIDKTGLYRDDR